MIISKKVANLILMTILALVASSAQASEKQIEAFHNRNIGSGILKPIQAMISGQNYNKIGTIQEAQRIAVKEGIQDGTIDPFISSQLKKNFLSSKVNSNEKIELSTNQEINSELKPIFKDHNELSSCLNEYDTSYLIAKGSYKNFEKNMVASIPYIGAAIVRPLQAIVRILNTPWGEASLETYNLVERAQELMIKEAIQNGACSQQDFDRVNMILSKPRIYTKGIIHDAIPPFMGIAYRGCYNPFFGINLYTSNKCVAIHEARHDIQLKTNILKNQKIDIHNSDFEKKLLYCMEYDANHSAISTANKLSLDNDDLDLYQDIREIVEKDLSTIRFKKTVEHLGFLKSLLLDFCLKNDPNTARRFDCDRYRYIYGHPYLHGTIDSFVSLLRNEPENQQLKAISDSLTKPNLLMHIKQMKKDGIQSKKTIALNCIGRWTTMRKNKKILANWTLPQNGWRQRYEESLNPFEYNEFPEIQ